MEETWELAVVSNKVTNNIDNKVEEKKSNLINQELHSEAMRTRRQRRIVLLFLASLFWIIISLTFYSLADQDLPKKILPILFNKNGVLEIPRLIALISAVVSGLLFTLGYASLISSAGIVKSFGAAAEVTAGLSKYLGAATIGVSFKEDQLESDEAITGSSHGEYSTINFPLVGEHDWQEPIVSASVRLQVELDRVANRSSNTLIWGIVISTIAVGFLFWIIFKQDRPAPKNFLEFWFYYGPRLSLVILAGLLSSFFLRLHVSAEREISRVRDEITNLELRLSSGLMAHQEGDLSIVSLILSIEDRYFAKNKNVDGSSYHDKISSIITDRINARLGSSND